MKKKVSLQDRVNQERESTKNFKQGFVKDSMALSALESSNKVLLSSGQDQSIRELFSSYQTSEISREQIEEDMNQTIALSTKIKSIIEQSAILVGERIYKAQKVMANYRGGIFNKWLLLVFGNKVTPYNILNYYNLYNSIEDQGAKGILERLPKRAAYKLASRKGELQEKIQVLNDYSYSKEGEPVLLKTSDVEKLIEKKFPINDSDNRTLGKKKIKDAKNEFMACIEKLLSLKHFLKESFFSDLEKSQIEDVILELKNSIDA